jgi:hypothetical protein
VKYNERELKRTLDRFGIKLIRLVPGGRHRKGILLLPDGREVRRTLPTTIGDHHGIKNFEQSLRKLTQGVL